MTRYMTPEREIAQLRATVTMLETQQLSDREEIAIMRELLKTLRPLLNRFSDEGVYPIEQAPDEKRALGAIALKIDEVLK